MSSQITPGVAVLLAPGFEEIEAIAPIDLLRRAGIRVRVLAVPGGSGTTASQAAAQQAAAEQTAAEQTAAQLTAAQLTAAQQTASWRGEAKSSLPEVQSTRGLRVLADDMLTADTPVHECVVLPGGMPGSRNLHESPEVNSLVLRSAEAGAWIAAICAAPAAVLGPLGLLDGRTFTCFPDRADGVGAGNYTGGRVEVDGRLLTSLAAGSATEFALKIIEVLLGGEASGKVARAIYSL